ncbi:DUF2463 domain-containing protein [Encephalitozoon hellem]|uniref:DUF2463 domain-containing protein n=1 Tax=Encephalitozoon hellem TaxID=27973 RepID=A0ABY8CI47_ENCHE|nr:DUF2463 domain-containing protein [Encephalitozoon hellem]
MDSTSHQTGIVQASAKHIFAIVSIAFPAVMHFLIGSSMKDSLAFKFMAIFLPFLYSASQNFSLFLISRDSEYKSPSLLHSILYFFITLSLIAFSAIDVISTIIFTLEKYDNDASFSILLPSFVVSRAYLLSTSCIFAPGSIQFTDTGFNLFIDILILLRIIAGIAFPIDDSSFIYIAALSFIFILLRSLNLGSRLPLDTDYALWRQLLAFFIFGISIFVYMIMARIVISVFINH